ncbi:MAG: thiamine phosphate synthase [Candidatus Dormibacteraeota bacterium]|jgi:thiamine-phosphate pyrophosphorylase|nr:thiamine phosphate synthase [Candidatus Dormibacteraeota bacterium]
MSQQPAEFGGLSTGSDRRRRLRAARLYLVSDDQTPDHELPRVLAAAIEGGIDLFQLRRKGVPAPRLGELARACSDICRAANVLFIVDDHVELAQEAGADGVHLGQEDTPLERARQLLGPEVLLGKSTHNRDQVLAAVREGADYVSAGPVHETPTKAGRPAVGFEHVSIAARQASVPVVAIGGMGRDEAALAIESGADMVGVVRAICSAADPRAAAAEIRGAMASAQPWSWIVINGTARKCRPQEHLGELAAALGVAEQGVVVEVNGEIPARERWDEIELRSGDRLEMVHFVGGGSRDR